MGIIENLEAMLAGGTDSAMLRFGLASAYFSKKDYVKAVEHFGHAVKIDRKYSAAWKMLGKSHIELGQSAQAIEAYQCGIVVAEQSGDLQTAKEMKVFLKRMQTKPS